MVVFGVIFIDWKNCEKVIEVMKLVVDVLKGGIFIIIFFEGMCSWDYCLGVFKKGVFYLVM